MTEKDHLICRIADREDSPADWTRFDALADQDRAVYERLIDTLRDEASLRQVVTDRLAFADQVDLVVDQVDQASVTPGLFARHPWLPQWSGWIAAAVLILVWMVSDPRMPRDAAALVDAGTDRVESQGNSGAAADHPVAARLANAGVLQELPNVMVEARPIPGSAQTEVIYLRRTLQRAVVSGAYTMARDEVGQPVRAQVDLARYAPRRNY